MIDLGLPPTGLGVYVRDALEPAPRWDFVVINAFRSDASEQAAAARALGASVWVYGTPENFQPATWRGGLAVCERVANRIGADGVIVDPEGGWLATRDHRAQAAALGTALGAVAGLRVGLTSYPEWRYLELVAATAGSKLWGSPQIYGRTSQSAATFQRWYSRWHAVFGERMAVSIAGWASSPALETEDGFRAYLAALPESPGRIVWDVTGRMPTRVSDALENARPSLLNRGMLLGTIPGALLVGSVIAAGLVGWKVFA